MVAATNEAGQVLWRKNYAPFGENKEGKLPKGDCREYTVDTPGASDRARRRVVQDQASGKTYYTDDHYGNFVQIDPKKR